MNLAVFDRYVGYELFYVSVVGVMKRGNIVPRVGIEPTSLAFRASVLPLHYVGFLMSPLYPRLPVHGLSEVSADHYTRPPWNCKS